MDDDFASESRRANSIRDYWVKKGYKGINVRVMPRAFRNSEGIEEVIGYTTKSNIGANGFPPYALAA